MTSTVKLYSPTPSNAPVAAGVMTGIAACGVGVGVAAGSGLLEQATSNTRHAGASRKRIMLDSGTGKGRIGYVQTRTRPARRSRTAVQGHASGLGTLAYERVLPTDRRCDPAHAGLARGGQGRRTTVAVQLSASDGRAQDRTRGRADDHRAVRRRTDPNREWKSVPADSRCVVRHLDLLEYRAPRPARLRSVSVRPSDHGRVAGSDLSFDLRAHRAEP